MKLIRRISLAFLCLLLTALCAFSAFSESVSYTIDDLGITLSLPSEMSVTQKSSGSLASSTYLEAKTSDDDFSITVTMISDENTKSIGELSNLSSTALSEFKDSLEAAEASENSLTEEIRSADYNGNLYIDMSQKQYLENDIISYIRQSMTIKNGMGIYITSVSVGDDFSSEELSIIRGCLESVSFEEIKGGGKSTTVWTVLIWILVIILILVLCFFGFVFYMRMRNAKRRKALRDDSLRKGDYRSHHTSSKSGTVGGYKTSADYFLRGYDTVEEKSDDTFESQRKPAPQKGKKKESVLTKTGYFFKNLSREIKKSNKRKASSSKKQVRIQSKDYDVFRDR